MEYVIEDIGDNRVSLYQVNGEDIVLMPESVMLREEALSFYNIRGEVIDGTVRRFDGDEDDENETNADILDYMGIEEDED